MRRALVVTSVLLLTGCYDFDGKLAACDAGLGPCAPDDAGAGADAGGVDAGGPDAGNVGDGGVACPGFSYQGFCWVNPTPTGENLLAMVGTKDDLWISGTSGLVMHWDGTSWADHRIAEVLGPSFADPNSPHGMVEALAVLEGRVVAAGKGLWPHLLQEGSWVVPFSDPVDMELRSIALDADGGFMAVGYRDQSAVTVSGSFASPAIAPMTGVDGLVKVLALPGDRGFVRIGHHGGNLVLLPADGGLQTLGAGPNLLGTAWLDGDRLWCGGEAGLLAQYDPATGALQKGNVNVANLDVAGGARFGQTLLAVGNNDAILEGPASGALQGLARVEISGSGHSTTGNSAVVATDDGWAYAIATGGLRYERNPTRPIPWSLAGTLHQDLYGAVPIDGGIAFFGGGALVGSVASASLVPVFEERVAGTAEVEALWVQGTRRWISHGGELCLVGKAGCERSTDLQLGKWTMLAGPSDQNLWAVGAGGHLAHLGVDGGWQQVDAGTSEDFIGASAFGAHVAAVSIQANGASALWVLEADGSVSQLSSFPVRVTTLSEAPGGTLWLAGVPEDGAHDVVITVGLDGGSVQQSYSSSSYPIGTAQDVVGVSSTEAYILDDIGYLWHIEGASWSQLETGTRRRSAYSLALSSDPSGRRSLWIVGAQGMIIHKPL